MQSTRKERFGWYFYDWANSAFSSTVITVFLGPYLTTVAQNAAAGESTIDVLGFNVHYGSFFPYALSASVVLQVLFLPLLGAIADYTRRKKLLLGIFAYIGAFSTMGFYFLQGANYMLGGALFILANLSFGASIVMYNAYLNDIAAPENRDSVSSFGWAFGYLGGGVLLALNLVLYTMSPKFGVDGALAVRICLASAGVWWAIFAVLPMLRLEVRNPAKSVPSGENIVNTGFKQLFRTIKEARKYPVTLKYLAAYLLYNDGVQAVIGLTSIYAVKELKLDMSFLIAIILMVQFLAFAGALLFNQIAKAQNAKNAILISLAIWGAAVFYSYAFLPEQSQIQFAIVSAVIALVLGGTQALSRSVYSKLIPKRKEAEYFSLYEISERGTSWLGPAVFGIAYQTTESYRIAILSLIAFFVAGFFLLLTTKVSEGTKLIQDENTAENA